MYKAMAWLTGFLLTSVGVQAATIDYTRIPADVTGYAHLDFDRFATSRFSKVWTDAKEFDLKELDIFGQHADITVFTPKVGTDGGSVVLLHTSDARVRHRIEGNLVSEVKISYANQEVHYADAGLNSLLDLTPESTAADKTDVHADAPAKPASTKKTSASFSIGFSEAGPSAGALFGHGPSYTAFIGDDLVVIASDLPSMADAVDVIAGRKPSLAKQDPHGLKIDVPTGAYFLGAGLTAQLQRGAPADSTSRPADAGNGAFGFDMFGSFNAKCRLARFTLGEDDQREYADGIFTMKDPESAGQLKNLIFGVKALISLTQSDYKPLIDPLTAQSNEADVAAHWEWPAAKLPELLRLSQTLNHEEGASASRPAGATHLAR